MTVLEAERAFREGLPCETLRADISTGKVLKFKEPFQIIYERHESRLTRIHLVFKSGEKSISQFQIEMLRLCEPVNG